MKLKLLFILKITNPFVCSQQSFALIIQLAQDILAYLFGLDSDLSRTCYAFTRVRQRFVYLKHSPSFGIINLFENKNVLSNFYIQKCLVIFWFNLHSKRLRCSRNSSSSLTRLLLVSENIEVFKYEMRLLGVRSPSEHLPNLFELYLCRIYTF